MDTLIAITSLLTSLPTWAWGALGVGILLAIIWFIIDFVSFLLVSAVLIVVGLIGASLGLDAIRALMT